MIKKNKPLSIVRQCRLLGLSRSGIYYKPTVLCEEETEIRRLIDIVHTNRPFLGSRRITDALQGVNYRINRKRVQRLMEEMDIQAIYPKPNTSKRNAKHKIYPYLLRNLSINKPNQVFATDVTYIPMPKGFAYLTVIMDWYSRKILSWRLSNSLDTSFCIDALEEALDHYGKPEIFNSDQGSQYTSKEFTGTLKANDVRISMDGKGAWRDNVFVERLWRSVKYEEVVCYVRDGRRMRLERCFTKDEGGPLGVSLQERAPNRHKLRELRAFVVSVAGKGGARLRQVWIEETNASEPLMTCRNVFKWCRNRSLDFCSVTKVGGRLLTAQLTPGMKAA